MPKIPTTAFGRTRWTADDAADVPLHYLSWGNRWFGKNPLMPPTKSVWWEYLMITEGSPIFHTSSGRHRASVGTVLIIRPDYLCGTEDRKLARCRQLCWVWKDAPALGILDPGKIGCRVLQVPLQVMRRIIRIHDECRLEIGRSDAYTHFALQRLRLQLDVELARALAPSETDSAVRIDLAISYLEQNAESQTPVRDLCEYLHIPERALKRLFRSHFGESPLKYIHAMRMRRAEELLENGGHSIKEIAFKLGYRHPNDFSRAYRKFSGVNASMRLRRTGRN